MLSALVMLSPRRVHYWVNKIILEGQLVLKQMEWKKGKDEEAKCCFCKEWAIPIKATRHVGKKSTIDVIAESLGSSTKEENAWVWLEAVASHLKEWLAEMKSWGYTRTDCGLLWGRWDGCRCDERGNVVLCLARFLPAFSVASSLLTPSSISDSSHL